MNESTATATMKPVVPGSKSASKKLVVWLRVRQMKLSATEQLSPSMKNKCTATSCPGLTLVMLMRVFCTAGTVGLEV